MGPRRSGCWVAVASALLATQCAHEQSAALLRKGTDIAKGMAARPPWALPHPLIAPTAARQPLVPLEPSRGAESRVSGVSRSGEMSPCERGTAPWRAARRQLDRSSTSIQALVPGDPPERALASIRSVLDHRCLRMHTLFADGLRGGSIAGIQRWWSEGGLRWIESMLEPDRDRARPGEEGYWFPPDEVASLTLATAGASSLASVLCADGDARCGSESLSWRARAEAILTDFDSALQRHRATAPDCAQETEPARTLLTWASCAHRRQRTRAALPIGRFRLPRGWLVVVNGATTDERPSLIVCDLDRGVIHSVEHTRWYDNRHKERTTANSTRVSATALREFALSVLIAGFVTDDSRTSEVQWIARRLLRTREAGVSGIVSSEPRFSRRLSGAHWLWFDGETARATGRLTADALSRAGSELVWRMWREIETARTQNDVVESLPEFLNVRVAREGDREAEAGDAIRAELLSLVRGLTARE